ncbi:MAG: LptF/LptG family permease [Gemmatimonadales bacterium]|jgi:lipopolysaccharide export system permease protein
MKILSRYVIRQHTAPFLFAFAALTGFMLLNQIARKLEQLVGKGLPWSVFVEFFLLTIPYLVAMTISMSVLVAVLHTFSRLARDSEITAFRAGGISLSQLVRPVLLAAAMVAVFSFLFQDQLLPRTNHRLRTLMTAIGKAKPTFELKEHVINEVQRGQVFLRASMIDQADYRMRDVTIYQYANRDPAIVYADSGRISFAPNNEDLLLELFDGTVHEFERRNYGNFQYTPFEKYVFKLEGIGSGDFVRPYEDNYYSDREMGTCELEDVVIDAKRQEWLANRQAEAAQRNGLRTLIGLPLIQADTAAPAPRRSLYCRLLTALLPPELEAQEIPRNRRQTDSTTAVVRTRITPMSYSSGASARARMNETRTQLERKRGNERRAAIYLVEFHKKYSIAAACIVFVLVGVPLALRFPGGLGMVIGFAMAIFGIYYVGLIAGESLANRLAISPFWAMWGPNVVLGVLGALALWRTARQGVAARHPDRRSKAWAFRASVSAS